MSVWQTLNYVFVMQTEKILNCKEHQEDSVNLFVALKVRVTLSVFLMVVHVLLEVGCGECSCA